MSRSPHEAGTTPPGAPTHGDPGGFRVTASRRGVTMLELVLVLIIAATMAAIAAPRYRRSLFHYRADAAARRIAADIDLARRSARASSSPRTITFDKAGETYTVSDLASMEDPDAPYVVDLTAPPYEARISVVDFGVDRSLGFDGWGEPSEAGSVTVTVGDVTRTVSVGQGSARVSIIK